MRVPFTKMHGAGNDFVLMDNRAGDIHLTTASIEALCHRRFGIGADGVLLLQRPEDPSRQHARMVYFNSDGSRAEMCGNGARCFTSFALAHGEGEGNSLRFLTDAGEISATRDGDEITVQMIEPFDIRTGISVPLQAGAAIVHHANTGVPHVVRFVDDVRTIDIRPEGAELRFHPAFGPKGANANFAQITPDGLVLVRTYERGVEDETLACGTGVTAVGILAHLVHGVSLPVRLRVAGGDHLTIGLKRDGDRVTAVTMTGPAKLVFTGEVDI
ncbi:diaminopimelate epimerase [Opitutales bacterium ASA1]|uniref:diaminopimelate epimerase n=1 Tax=Congregicoccus parvus TaxID=3081749 RepID=UPI002B27D03C|nr:diaminopimelate epimerase [Opitutales bacterium ASA1]